MRRFPGGYTGILKPRKPDQDTAAEKSSTTRSGKSKRPGVQGPRGGGSVPARNRQVVSFAIQRLGKQVGDGECWTLAAEALKAAGAQPPRGYVFGQELPLEEARPGDILQFSTARFETPRQYKLLGTPRHTAIVYSVAGKKTFILHQNFGSRKVTTLDLDFANMVSGAVKVYRPQARGPAGER